MLTEHEQAKKYATNKRNDPNNQNLQKFLAPAVRRTAHHSHRDSDVKNSHSEQRAPNGGVGTHQNLHESSD
jgi:hypothetical protein